MRYRTLALLTVTLARVTVAPLHPKLRAAVAKSVPRALPAPRHGIAPARCGCCVRRKRVSHSITKRAE